VIRPGFWCLPAISPLESTFLEAVLETSPLTQLLSRFCWLLVLRRVLAIVFGISPFVWPELTLVTMVKAVQASSSRCVSYYDSGYSFNDNTADNEPLTRQAHAEGMQQHVSKIQQIDNQTAEIRRAMTQNT